APLGVALLTDAALLAIFALQHSVMARQGFKTVWTRIVPKPVKRSTYVLAASAALLLLFWKWEPIGGVIWQEQSVSSLLQGLSLLGFIIVLISTFLIDHFDLFGLRQVFLYLRGIPYTPVPFIARGWYGYVRHPIYLGFIIAFWATPRMTIAQLVFAVATTAYLLIAIRLAARAMVRAHAYVVRTCVRRSRGGRGPATLDADGEDGNCGATSQRQRSDGQARRAPRRLPRRLQSSERLGLARQG